MTISSSFKKIGLFIIFTFCVYFQTIRMIENGIKPVYVFDGKPPTMKSGELEKRMEKRADTQVALEKAKEEGNDEEIDKQSRRLVKVTKDHVEDCKKLLKLMGVPYIQAPCEAESQCAEVGYVVVSNLLVFIFSVKSNFMRNFLKFCFSVKSISRFFFN